jgi:hypothetical protein
MGRAVEPIPSIKMRMILGPHSGVGYKPALRGGRVQTLHAILLDPGHGPIDELPLPKESRRCLADKAGVS